MANPDDVYDYLVSRGASPAGAAGVVGNLQGESGQNLDPGIVGDGGTSGGIAQWHNSRWSALKAFAAGQGRSWSDLGVQEQYLVKDLQSYGLWQQITSATNPDDVVSSLVRRYEMPADPSGAIARRTPLARAVLQKDAPGVFDRIKGVLGDPVGAVEGAAGGAASAAGDAISSAGSAVAGTLLKGAQPLLWKGLFVALGVGLLGFGVVKALDVKGAPA